MLDREVRTQTVGYGGSTIYKDTVYNDLGQVYYVSRPYYNNAYPYWTYYTYDILGRVTSVSLPTASSSAGSPLATTSYNGLSTQCHRVPQRDRADHYQGQGCDW